MVKLLLCKYKVLTALLVSLAIIIAVGFFALNTRANERVEIETATDPELEFVAIHGTNSSAETWEPKGNYKEPSKGKYVINTNSYAQWWEADSLHFAYKKFKFNYGKTGMLTVTTQLDSWNGLKPEAGAGLMLRSSLDPSAATVMLHCRPGKIMITYRAGDKNTSIKGKELDYSLPYPVKFKAELAANKVICYYMPSNGKTWVKFGTVPFVNLNPDVYVGISAYSQDKDFTATAQFTGFNVLIDAEEGYTADDNSQGGDSSGENTSSEDAVVLPEDIPVPENVLLSETFTDGSLKNKPESRTNWTWKYYDSDNPEILLDDEKTNRYLYDWDAENRYYYAGDQSWTDYETSVDLTFTSDYSEDAENGFYLYVRHTNIAQYGFYDYVVYFKSVKGKQSINLGIRQHTGRITNAPTNLISIPYKYLPSVGEADQNINLRVVTFDNKISVYTNDSETPIIYAVIDGKQMSIYENGSKEATVNQTGEASIVHTEGCIGFMTNKAAVKIDNIRVTKLEDYLGGDYDNRIGGNWDTAITKDHYLYKYQQNDWIY